ncbi:phosphorylase b kinase regulatory [Trichuris trichiura]|uniref:Phosphorylase b kinase regulatory subunit n=1 Tax=Trichuris trichiura TaxID=36087 RepID=A0A077Z722_TRITR|nr:phosphorylase b kinase regulatory [Trichuris trichiura]
MSSEPAKLDRLNYYTRAVYKTILIYTDPVTGLFCSPVPSFKGHAWVRDNVYAVHCVWALALAYRKLADLDSYRPKGYEFEQATKIFFRALLPPNLPELIGKICKLLKCLFLLLYCSSSHICIKVMRSLLTCFMGQANKVEDFKKSQSPKDALHAKYSACHLSPIVGDHDWGHLQLDAISIYLLTLAQMTASGLQVVFSIDEVAFVQNLVFYIEHAYRIPVLFAPLPNGITFLSHSLKDYGIWERGDKTNHGVPELNATSIGMAKAALQALNGLDLFGTYGSPNSVIHVMTDEIEQCDAVLRSLLPRESYSKETDAGLLSIISYPAFAVGDPAQISTTRVTIVDKLQGKYGCRRFLRDGYRTPREDPNRLYYEPYELQKFENLECEWPLFFCYLFIDAHFNNNQEKAKFYRNCLDQVVIKREDDLPIVPELYAISEENVDAEIREPHSQERFPTGAAPFLWAQSLYILGCLIEEDLIKLAEMDPLNRRLSTEVRPDTVVQVAVLAEDEDVRSKLAAQGIDVELVANADPFVVLPAQILGRMYAQLGRNAKMNLTGRRSMDVGLLSTSKMYIVENRIFVFTPQFLDWSRFYLTHDLNILIDTMKSELLYVKTTWNVPGRPLVVFVFSSAMVTGATEDKQVPLGMIGALKKIKSGYLSGTRTVMGKIGDFVTTSCITKLHFLSVDENVDPEMRVFLSGILHGPQRPALVLLQRRKSVSQEQAIAMPAYVRGISQRHKSIVLDPNDIALIKLRINGGTESRRSSSGRDEHRGSEDGSDTTPRASPDREEVPAIPIPLLRYADYASLNEVQCTELVDMLLETDLLEEQADIVLYLWAKKGPDWNTRLGGRSNVPVKKLVEEIYEKASRERCWWLVRYTAGLLKKVTEILTNAVTALLIRQKQITIGMPTIREERIVSPLLPEELLKLIRNIIGDDECGIMITQVNLQLSFHLLIGGKKRQQRWDFFSDDLFVQEVLIYLGMFIRTEPHLFTEMMRLRVGLIIQVMISELARGLRISGTFISLFKFNNILARSFIMVCSGEEAATQVTNLSPYELKTLLHHILSGKEMSEANEENTELITYTAKSKAEKTGILRLQKQLKQRKMFADDTEFEDMNPEQSINWLQWLRRRRIDGALNRVPPDFYSRIWRLLRTCEGVIVGGQVLHRNLTQEMTTGEYKFALTVESVLNKIPDPEYRQLLVEVMMVLTLVSETHTNLSLGTGLVNADNIVRKANEIFLADQKAEKGDAMACCCIEEKKGSCGGAHGICKHFYDSPPSGRYGTITYMCRGVVCLVPQLGDEIECSVS